jgi:hypothetical protein
MSEQIWEKLRFSIGVSWLWIENNGREVMSRPKLKKSCSTKITRRLFCVPGLELLRIYFLQQT